MHGNGINIGANVAHANRFHQLGFSVLLIDYRGYGRSQGSFQRRNAGLSRCCAHVGITWCSSDRFPKKKFISTDILARGAIAIDLAVKHPDAANFDCRKLFYFDSAVSNCQEHVFHVSRQFNSDTAV